MKYPAGCVFSLAEKNAPIPGCTVSEAVSSGETDAVCFSLAAGTDISAEIYFSPKLLIAAGGDARGLPARRTIPDTSRAGRYRNTRGCSRRNAHGHIRRLS